jgi:hypothetical protein
VSLLPLAARLKNIQLMILVRYAIVNCIKSELAATGSKIKKHTADDFGTLCHCRLYKK